MISLIAAMSRNRVIGKDNAMPWHLPADLQWFKQTTLGKPVVMGRKTFESLGRPLPKRRNIVVTHDAGFSHEGCEVANSLCEVITMTLNEDEIMIIGGAKIYEQMLPVADRLYLTYIDAELEGDTCFPEFDPQRWQEIERVNHAADENNPHAYSFVILDRTVEAEGAGITCAIPA